MDKTNIEPWERAIKKKLNKAKRTTNGTDFSSFMEKLEDSGYFEQNKKSPFGWILSTILILCFVSGYIYFTSINNEKIIKSTTTEQPSIKSKTKMVIDSTPILTPKISIKENKRAIPLKIKKKEKLIEKELPQIKTIPVNSPITLEEKSNSNSLKIVQEDSTQYVRPVKQRKLPTFILSVDTTIVTDTNHVKHRRKKKKKKK